MTEAELSASIAALKEAIADGALVVDVTINGERKRVEYASFGDLKARLDYFEGELAKLARRPRSRASVMSFSRGG